MFSKATIRFVAFFSPDSVLSNPPAQTTPCYEFIKKLPTLHPFISVSRVGRKPEPHFQCVASHTRGTHSQRLSTDGLHCITDFPSCAFTFPHLFWYDCALSTSCFVRIKLRKRLHVDMKTG